MGLLCCTLPLLATVYLLLNLPKVRKFHQVCKLRIKKNKKIVVSGCIHYQSSLMAQLSLTEVSKRFNVNRTTIYRAVSSGKLSRLNNGLFDLAEVIRVFGEAPTAEAAPVKKAKAHDG